MRFASISLGPALRRFASALAAIAALAMPAAFPSFAGEPAKQGCDILVVTEPPDATVEFDGAVVQSLTPATIHAVTGIHLLAISRNGFEETRHRFHVGPADSKLTIKKTLEPVLGLVLIHSQPQGADVTIDDIPRGQTPLLLTDLRLGRYRVRATMPGTLPAETMLDVDGRVARKLDLVLRANSGQVSCSSEPAGADITFNGIARGQTPCTIHGIVTGRTVVAFSLEGYQTHEETIDISAGGETNRVQAILKPLPATLVVNSIPDGAVIYLDNARRGTTPVTLDGMAPGQHRLRAELQGYDPVARTVELTPGKNTPEEFRLARVAGALEVTTTPPGVRVLVDNVERGITQGDPEKPNERSAPLLVENLEPGKHAVLMSRKGYAGTNSTVEVIKSQKTALQQELRRVFAPDTLLRTNDGEMYTGAIAERNANGDIRLELKPGTFKVFKKSDIRSLKSLTTDNPSP
ncbi:MAG: PEGA domain-containing protein [bacterium]